MSRRRIVVAGLTAATEEDPTLAVSRARLSAGDEVVHLGGGLDVEAVARATVAEDAAHVVLVGGDEESIGRTRAALEALGAGEVTVAGA